jgi:hypothetical protein
MTMYGCQSFKFKNGMEPLKAEMLYLDQKLAHEWFCLTHSEETATTVLDMFELSPKKSTQQAIRERESSYRSPTK